MAPSKKEENSHMNGSDDNDSNDSDGKIVIRGLRLEAIFHPKFDNERKKNNPGKKGKGLDKNIDASRDIRSAMLQKLGLGSGYAKDESSIQRTGNDDGYSEEQVKGTGHLEVSLKHSGSLVLWSGSTRYYSKNSACNEFTRTAEILLRQRFETVRRAMASSSRAGINVKQNDHCYSSYEDCSRFISRHRYTIAFEVVTAEMLGDHGQIPNIDYVVVTAVANRSHERFLSTTEVLDFCHRFRLPHNDVWTFFPSTAARSTTAKGIGTGARSSAENLFQMYDNSLRETGYTEDTVKTLTSIADVYIPSPIPHSIFQGSICEGFIVRYVDDGNVGPEIERQQLELAQSARDILKEVPPSPTLSSGRAPNNLKTDPVLDADLRALYQSINYSNYDEYKSHNEHKPSLSAVALQHQRAAMFSKGLEKLLQDEDKIDRDVEGDCDDNERQLKRPRQGRQRHDLKKITKEQEHSQEKGDKKSSAPERKSESMRSIANRNLPLLTKNLLESQDLETKRIATLLQTLDELKGGAVKYTWMEKYDNEYVDDKLDCTTKTRRWGERRLYCIIHVLDDSTFFKFQKLQSSSDMTLFRGFCVEVLLSSSDKKEEEAIDWGGDEISEYGSIASTDDEQPWKQSSSADGASGTPLMLKMKLLPYMVRTFICRNSLNTIHQKGPEEFERIALRLLEKWKISKDAQGRWVPFFRGWALYVLENKTEQPQSDLPKSNNSSSATEKKKPTSFGSAPLELGPLTNFSYLRHIEHFTKLYESGKFRTVSSTNNPSSPQFQTFICIVSQSTEVSLALANHFANRLYDNDSSKTDKLFVAKAKMVVCSLGEAAKNRRSKSCIAYANVGDLTKGIKKFISDKKVAKQSVLVLVGSNKDETIALIRSAADTPPDGTRQASWLDVSSESEVKKLINMWKSWMKFPCARRAEIGRYAVELEPKKEGSTAAIITRINGTQEIIDSIKEVGRSLIEQDNKKHSDPSRGGILVFFPGIPGCGKSSLVQSLQTKLEEEMELRKADYGDLYNRRIHVKEGDKVGKNFWNMIEDLLSDDDVVHGESSALVIADKNAPPASWPKLGQIGHDSNSIILPVFPNSSALETTTIEGSILPDGTLLPHSSHFYPFSLKFLAVSLYRVLSRPPGEHTGKLDSGFPTACMVVVQFFSFYRYIGADTFNEKMKEKFDKNGTFSLKTSEPIELPFLTASARDHTLPDDLKKLLEEALQLRHGHDKNKKSKVKKEDPQMIDLEGRLRSSIEMHKEAISTMTENLEDTKEAFTLQLMDRIKSLNSKLENTAKPPLINHAQQDDISDNVKLVSLDIDRIEVHKLLQKYHESGILKSFFDSIELSSQSSLPKPKTEDSDTAMTDADEVTSKLVKCGSKEITIDRYTAPNFIETTHVTMSFAGENDSAKTLISKFRHLQGQDVTVSITGFLWSSSNAALAIRISSSTVGDDPIPIPPCENPFEHVTVWCAPDVKAYLSNQLPNLVESGKANLVDFAEEDVLIGKICFWNHENESFKI
jgi:hypothetical protein